jgi:hypothetical protein
MKVLETIWLFMVGLLIPIAVMFYYVDIGWNPVSTNGDTHTMQQVGTDPIHQGVPRSPVVDSMTKIVTEWAAKGLQEVEAHR